MVTPEENEKLTRIGPGTPMGELMRRYWIPAAMSSEIEADGPPLRLMLLGEQLVAFRDSAGRVGILDHACPHRCASLFYGRNEEGGLRCIYHGWKFDVEGRCLDMANVPPQQDFKAKIRATAYKTAERNGIVWTYMGPLDEKTGEPPALPAIEATLLPAQAVTFNWMQRECNWLQVLEGDLDTSHVDFLHGGARTEKVFAPDDPRRFGAINRSPEYEIGETEWGTMYGAFRPADPGETYWRIAHFLFPFWTITPSGPFGRHIYARAWVPMDDTHTMSMRLLANAGRVDPGGAQQLGIVTGLEDLLPNSSDWYGRWRPRTCAANDYLMDRHRQRTNSFSGIPGIAAEDQAVTESMGGIVKRMGEHLAPSDRMIAVTRRRLMEAAEAVARGEAPPAANAQTYAGARGGYFIAKAGGGMLDAYRAAGAKMDKAPV
jgi:phenylpropionate dioxygenase-like ring-hydroxylating dioxygenase large terminal subunit